MKALGDGKEILVSVNQAPVDGDSQGQIGRNHAAQQFRNPAAGGSGIHIAESQAFQILA